MADSVENVRLGRHAASLPSSVFAKLVGIVATEEADALRRAIPANSLGWPAADATDDSANDPSRWRGVRVSASSVSRAPEVTRVVALRISRARLAGPLPALDALPGLEELDLSRNHLSGALGACAWCALPRLALVRLSHNRLTGPVPTELARRPAREFPIPDQCRG